MKLTSALLAVLAVTAFTGLSLMHPRLSASAVDAKPNALREQIISKEREELDSLKAGDMKAFASLIADDAVFLDPHGSAGKDEVVKQSSAFKLLEYSMEDVKFVPISPKSGVIAYKLVEKGASHGKEFSAQVYASAVWTQRGDKWVCLFSQETPARQQ